MAVGHRDGEVKIGELGVEHLELGAELEDLDDQLEIRRVGEVEIAGLVAAADRARHPRRAVELVRPGHLHLEAALHQALREGARHARSGGAGREERLQLVEARRQGAVDHVLPRAAEVTVAAASEELADHPAVGEHRRAA